MSRSRRAPGAGIGEGRSWIKNDINLIRHKDVMLLVAQFSAAASEVIAGNLAAVELAQLKSVSIKGAISQRTSVAAPSLGKSLARLTD